MSGWGSRWDCYYPSYESDDPLNLGWGRKDVDNNYDDGILVTYYSKANIFSTRTERDDTIEPGILYRHLEEDDDEIEGPTLVKRR